MHDGIEGRDPAGDRRLDEAQFHRITGMYLIPQVLLGLFHIDACEQESASRMCPVDIVSLNFKPERLPSLKAASHPSLRIRIEEDSSYFARGHHHQMFARPREGHVQDPCLLGRVRVLVAEKEVAGFDDDDVLKFQAFGPMNS